MSLICEHCGTRLTLEGMPMDALDAVIKCPKCEGIITEKSWNLAHKERKST